MVERLAEELIHRVKDFQDYLNSNEWKKYSRKSFVHALDSSIQRLEEIQKIVYGIKGKMEQDPGMNAPNLEPLARDYASSINVLRRNLVMEQDKKEKEEWGWQQQIEVPELYGDLSNKILSLLLKTRFILEQVHLHTRSEKLTPLDEKSTASHVMSLLKTREKEFHDLREKHEELKHHAFIGKAGEKSSIDLEHDLNDVAVRLEKSRTELEGEMKSLSEKIDLINDSFADVKEKFDSAEHLMYGYLSKGPELVSLLKREKDFAKKVLLDIEHESLQLRSSYSRELLNLQHSKLKAKEEAKKENEKKMRSLEKEVRERDSLVEDLRKIISHREKRVENLEKQLHSAKAHSIYRSYKLRLKGPKKKEKD